MVNMIELQLNCDLIDNYLVNNDWLLLAEYFRDNFKIQRDFNGKPLLFKFSEETVNILCKTLSFIKNNPLNNDLSTFLQELFRALRNCVLNKDFQIFLTNKDEFLSEIQKIITETSDYSLIKVILQFLINLTVGNELATSKVSNLFLEQVKILLNLKVCVYEDSALIYNISLFFNLQLDLEFCKTIFNLYESEESREFLHFLIEIFVADNKFWILYMNLEVKHRIVVLEIIRNCQIKGKPLKPPQNSLIVLIKQFLNSNRIIFQTATETEYSLEPYEVALLLEILASFSANEEFLPLFQTNKNFIINCGVLLINIHRLGKESQNYFSSLKKLEQVTKPNQDLKHHPAFGFKASLVRIIANLCWKNRQIQDLVREAELIPVLLDCCNIDAKNPFIMQWAILAIRNLCESNLDNQKLIEGLHKQGTVSSEVLEEMGLTLHNDSGNCIKIVALENLNK